MSLATAAALAAASQVYTWEPPDRVIAARYGLDPADILRFDVNTSPAAPDIVAAILAGPSSRPSTSTPTARTPPWPRRLPTTWRPTPTRSSSAAASTRSSASLPR